MTDTRFKRIEKKKTQELISYDHSVWKDIKKELFCTDDTHQCNLIRKKSFFRIRLHW